jgi:hypothetical protein
VEAKAAAPIVEPVDAERCVGGGMTCNPSPHRRRRMGSFSTGKPSITTTA